MRGDLRFRAPWRRHLRAAVGAGAVLLALALCAPAVAAPSGLEGLIFGPRPEVNIYGMVPAAQGAHWNPHRPTPAELAGTVFAALAGNLTYHGGPVMHTNDTYAIYWMPSGSAQPSANYAPLINQYFGDVAATPGAKNNVYSPGVQYTDSAGAVQVKSTFEASWTDTATAIPDDCSGEYDGTGVTVSGCVTDADIQNEVENAIAQNGWTPTATSEFFVFTAPNVGSCFDTTSGECAYSYYCAYHSNFLDGQGRNTIYANMPYSDSTAVGAPGACDSGDHPNGDWADATINLVSHEHNESITDPNGNAWYDGAGNENGDKCVWTFGQTAPGSPPAGSGAAYNQVINNHDYFLQREWSNASKSCVLGYAPAVPLAIAGFTPGSGAAGTTVTITGSRFTGASAVKFNNVSATYTVDSSTSITAKVPTNATSGAVSVTVSGKTVTSSARFTVLPAITSLSSTSGRVSSAVTINGTGFSGVRSVKFNGKSAGYTVNSSQRISTHVPSGATSGPITVTTSTGTATSPVSFTVTTATRSH